MNTQRNSRWLANRYGLTINPPSHMKMTTHASQTVSHSKQLSTNYRVYKNMTRITELRKLLAEPSPLMSWERSVRIQLELLTGSRSSTTASTVGREDTLRESVALLPRLPTTLPSKEEQEDKERELNTLLSREQTQQERERAAWGRQWSSIVETRGRVETPPTPPTAEQSPRTLVRRIEEAFLEGSPAERALEAQLALDHPVLVEEESEQELQEYYFWKGQKRMLAARDCWSTSGEPIQLRLPGDVTTSKRRRQSMAHEEESGMESDAGSNRDGSLGSCASDMSREDIGQPSAWEEELSKTDLIYKKRLERYEKIMEENAALLAEEDDLELVGCMEGSTYSDSMGTPEQVPMDSLPSMELQEVIWID
jgi:hypothetical protein